MYALESQGAGEREKRRVITANALDQPRLGQRALRGCQHQPAWIDRDEKNIDVLVGIGGTIEPSRIDRQRPDWTLEANDATGHTPFDAARRHLEADAVAARRSEQMHAALEADTEDGNTALAGRAAGPQCGRRAAVLLRYANPTDVHSHKAIPAEVPVSIRT